MTSANEPQLSEDIRAARRRLEELSWARLIEPIFWHPEAKTWVLHCRIASGEPSKPELPSETEWYVSLDSSYPRGSIKFYPAKSLGLKGTFQHQSLNFDRFKDRPWLVGDLCLNSEFRALGGMGLDPEPRAAEERLLWHFNRALGWLRKAHAGELILPGEPFELPVFQEPTENTPLAAYLECQETFSDWQSSGERWGVADVGINKEPYIFMVREYLTASLAPVKCNYWNDGLQTGWFSRTQGLWILLKSLPLTTAWQVPRTWDKLTDVLARDGIELTTILGRTSYFFRDGTQHPIMLGVPIPRSQGEEPVQIHWQTALLPRLSYRRDCQGFRPNEAGFRARDRAIVFKANPNIRWVKSENWARHEISSRGMLPEGLSDSRILLVGGGALGSAVAELVVRGGARSLTLIDAETLSIGNLVRHTLTIGDVGKYKADQLKARLQSISPEVEVSAYSYILSDFLADPKSDLSSYEIIIDTTGDDDVLEEIKEAKWERDKHFVSLSIGYQAKHLFCYRFTGSQFEFEPMRTCLAPIIESNRERALKEGFKREGIGCWHPVFPARADDIWLLASASIKWLCHTIATSESTDLTVYNQVDDAGFGGLEINKII